MLKSENCYRKAYRVLIYDILFLNAVQLTTQKEHNNHA